MTFIQYIDYLNFRRANAYSQTFKTHFKLSPEIEFQRIGLNQSCLKIFNKMFNSCWMFYLRVSLLIAEVIAL